MNQKLKLYIPLIIGAVIIIVALIYIFGVDKDTNNVQVPVAAYDNSSNAPSSASSTPETTNTTATVPSTTPDTNSMPPPVPPIPSSPSEPTAENVSAPATNTANVQCTSTNGVLNYSVKGIVTVTDNGTVSTYTDYCRQTTGAFKGYVFKYYCNGTAMASINYKCPRGCTDGACP
jgi:cytoskeletal protein RodZ